MSEFSGCDAQEVVEKIECYLKNHPNSADTIESITKWWFPGKGLRYPV
jgi:hypothetical protein